MKIYLIEDNDNPGGDQFLLHLECFDHIADNMRHPLYHLTNEDNYTVSEGKSWAGEACYCCKRPFETV